MRANASADSDLVGRSPGAMRAAWCSRPHRNNTAIPSRSVGNAEIGYRNGQRQMIQIGSGTLRAQRKAAW
ncbi:hypothetical protein ADT25_02400 [Xanthomonas oryzae]|uniref:Uncharacterized protein n=1 Tax=Xanthomonas oryzae TaxID=347 RepID=A0AAP0ZPR7_9XANT|nr:hypothetical protein ADT25_02400 [Xanthomonas oryzae]QBG84753.1 hypothetical protein EYR27_13950 [Xanthomonas oryzae]